MTNYQSSALNQIPNYAETLAALTRAQKTTLPEPTAAVATVETAARARLYAGEPVGDLIGDLARARDAESTWQLATGVLRGLVVGFESDLTVLRSSGAATALQWLHAQLEQAIAPLAEHRALLAEISTGDEAIKAGPAAVDVWQRVQAAATAVDGIRTAQRSITLAASAGDGAATVNAGKNVSRYGIVRDAGSRHPLASEGTVRVAEPAENPWPTAGVDQVLWAVRDGVQLWVPTLAQLDEAVAEHAQAVRVRRRANEAGFGRGRQISPTDERRVDATLRIYQQNAALQSQRDDALSRPASPFA